MNQYKLLLYGTPDQGDITIFFDEKNGETAKKQTNTFCKKLGYKVFLLYTRHGKHSFYEDSTR